MQERYIYMYFANMIKGSVCTTCVKTMFVQVGEQITIIRLMYLFRTSLRISRT